MHKSLLYCYKYSVDKRDVEAHQEEEEEEQNVRSDKEVLFYREKIS